MTESTLPVNLQQIYRRFRERYLPSLNEGPAPHLSATLAMEGLLAAVVGNLATTYSQMFASRLGATDAQIGYVSSLPQLLALLVLIPGAMIASRSRDRRRPVELAIVVYGILYGIAGLSPWIGNLKVWFFIGAISLANAPLALYNATWQSYFSEIVPISMRNSYYARRTSMTFFAGIIIVQAVGLILGSAQSDNARIWLYQSCYWLAFIMAMLQMSVMRRAPHHIGEPASTRWSDLRAAGLEMIRCRGFVIFCAISIFFHMGWYMSWPLFFINQIDYLGANETWLALIAVPANILQWLTTRFWGRFVEKHGVRLTLVIGCLGLAANPMLSVAAAYFPEGWKLPGMLVLNLVCGATFSAFILSILQCMLEIVPARYRTINISVYTSILLLANTIAPLIGVRLYTLLGSDLRAMTFSMLISSVIRLVGTVFFFLRWRRMRRQCDSGMLNPVMEEPKHEA